MRRPTSASGWRWLALIYTTSTVHRRNALLNTTANALCFSSLLLLHSFCLTLWTSLRVHISSKSIGVNVQVCSVVTGQHNLKCIVLNKWHQYALICLLFITCESRLHDITIRESKRKWLKETSLPWDLSNWKKKPCQFISRAVLTFFPKLEAHARQMSVYQPNNYKSIQHWSFITWLAKITMYYLINKWHCKLKKKKKGIINALLYKKQ